MAKRILKSLFWYALAPPVFLWSWSAEQRFAVHMAWLDSFASAHDEVRKIWKSGEPK